MTDFSKQQADKFSYLNNSRRCLDMYEAKKASVKLRSFRKTWTTAAIIALTSGSAILFSTQQVKADTTTPDSAETNVNNQQGTTEAQTNDISAAVKTAATNIENQSQNDSSKATLQTQNTRPADDSEDQTSDEAGQKEKNGVELPANNQDLVKGNVKDAWDQGYKGQHTVVAVIDSGVDTSHKDFQTMPSDPKFTADEMKEKIAKLGYGEYVNEKFPYVYNYVDNDNGHYLPPDDEPHGQHVSGIIGADGHPDGDAEYIVGIAPEAQLMHLKVFGENTTQQDIAKEIIDATNLGADVINMSLGGGVSGADLTVADQKAVQYAIDHGVIVTISASNNGNAASVASPTHLTDTDNYESGTNAGNYSPFNGNTIADPGAALGAITVAAETSGLGENSDMASFTSWGALPDFTLKPDVSAPGVDVISTANHDQYQSMSGTSMASPFVAGSATLVKQRLAQTNPELQGAALVEAVKALLMNTAHPQTQNGYTTLVSPRRQGAGQIDVGAATKAQAYITASDGTSSVSLKKVGNSTDFELTFHNLSNEEQNYTFDDFGGGFTEDRDETNGIFHDVQLAGARVTTKDTITIAPKETKTFTFNLGLTGLKENQPVEGYLNFTNTKDNSTLVVPYLSYYGDMTNEYVFDKNANDKDSADIMGNRFVNEDNYPRGIADQESLKELINVDGTYNWQEVAKLYESGKVAFSPNGDNKSDLIKPYTYLKQNLEDLKVEILDSTGKIVRVLTDSHGVQKSYNSDGDGTVDMGYGVSNADAFDWDGKLYDYKTGQLITAPDGNYTYRFIATLVNDGTNKIQTNDTAVILDTTAPVLSNVNYDSATYTLTGNYEDQGAGFTDYSYATVTVNDQVFGFKLNDGAESGFDNDEKTKGHFSFTLTTDEQKALTNAQNKLSLALSDAADNTAVKTFDVASVSGNKEIAIWNATNGLAFNEKSPDYNADTETYNLRGSANSDFYVNGKLVQVNNGQFVVPVSTDQEDLVFTSDEAGKDILERFANYTPKAKFAWQHVDGENHSFGPQIYSIYGSNPDDIVVQAAVTKGDNVQAFAKDYFTGTIYTGEVKDGVATFHVKTSINRGKDGIYARALLQGWTEIDGPTFNDKQKTDPTDIKDENYIGVYYDPDATSHVYTNRDDLGVENFTDEVADAQDFGPTNYPGYDAPNEGSPDVSFDYLSDNNVSVLGNEAVTNGYYNPETHVFTLTGQANDKVTSLTFLADSPNENDPNNQADISNDGKFTVTFKMDSPSTRQLSYFYKTVDGKTTYGSLSILLDTVLPTLTVNGITEQSGLEFTTNQPVFVLNGKANDNLDGYGVFIDGDNIFTQYANGGFDYLAEINKDNPDPNTPNPFPAYEFEKQENLDDENGQPTTHVFTVAVVDQAGNRVEKKFTVHFNPNWKPTTPEQKPTDPTNNESSSAPITPIIVPSEPVEAVSSTGNVADHAIKIKLTHNAYVYNIQGEKVENNGTAILYKKNDYILAWNNGNAVTIKNKKYYQVGSNMFVKVANTLDNRKLSKRVSNVVKRIKLVRNSFVYDHKGKALKKGNKHVTLKKNTYIKAWNNGKVVTLKNKKYYQIGKDKFVKVVNTVRLVKLL